jgi:hypothetical protein
VRAKVQLRRPVMNVLIVTFMLSVFTTALWSRRVLTADAGPDQSGVFVGNVVNLTGAGSVGATTFNWTFASRPAGSAAVLLAAAIVANTMGVLMKRAAAGVTAPEYHLTAVERIATLEKELNAAAQKGFVVVPGTVTKAGAETIVLSRRTSGSPDRYSYRVLKSDDAVENNLRDMASKGFSPVGAFLQQSGFGAMMSSPTTGSLHIVLQGPVEGSSVVPAAPRACPVDDEDLDDGKGIERNGPCGTPR